MSLLTICQDAADSLGLSQPATIISNTNAQARQLLYFAKEEMNSLAYEYLWQQLVKEGSISGTGASAYALPSDFGYFLPNTMWDRTADRQAIIPLTAEDWQYIKAWNINPDLNRKVRVIDSQFTFYTALATSDGTIYYEYISKNKIESSGGTEYENFGHASAADTDVSKLPEYIVTLGLIWRYAQARGHDRWQADKYKYEMELSKLMQRNNPTRGLSMGRRFREYVPGVTVTDNGYG